MSRELKIKVCGMKSAENRRMVEQLEVDLLGYIFYAPSGRFVGESPDPELFHSEKLKVGVFVNDNAFEILRLCKKLGLDYVQLHGSENPKTCRLIRKQGIKVIKAFSVDQKFNFSSTTPYEGIAHYFLFDTKSPGHGGSGKKFDWSNLSNYTGHTPFFLSGGIGPEDAEMIKTFTHKKLTGVDLNSGFEDAPGLKNIEQLTQFIKEIKSQH